jgi:hypothetical protein
MGLCKPIDGFPATAISNKKSPHRHGDTGKRRAAEPVLRTARLSSAVGVGLAVSGSVVSFRGNKGR